MKTREMKYLNLVALTYSFFYKFTKLEIGTFLSKRMKKEPLWSKIRVIINTRTTVKIPLHCIVLQSFVIRNLGFGTRVPICSRQTNWG